MGIYNRDYVQGGDPYGQGGYSHVRRSSGHSAVIVLVIINVVVYFLQLWNRPGAPGITEWLELSVTDLRSFEIWRLLTYGFCHDPQGNMHLIANMWMLWIFGRLIEPIYGSREFYAFYLTGIVLSGVGHVGFQLVTGSNAAVIGASGGVMAVIFLTAMIFPREKILLFFVIPLELRWLAVAYLVLDLLGTFGGATGVAHVAHLAGAGFGVAYKYFDWRLTGFSGNWFMGRLFPRRKNGGTIRPSKPKASKHVKLYEPPPPADTDLENRVDVILDKIHTEGEASLTDEEREILKKASQQYKNRTKP